MCKGFAYLEGKSLLYTANTEEIMTKKMTRREALKTLGLALGTVTASVSSVSGLTFCKEKTGVIDNKINSVV